MTRPRRLTFAIFVALVALANASRAGGAAVADWPGWRGPHGDGRSDEAKLPTRWNAIENIHWKVPIPGRGHSSPVVWGDMVFLATAIEANQKRLLLCLNRLDGSVLWEREVLR